MSVQAKPSDTTVKLLEIGGSGFGPESAECGDAYVFMPPEAATYKIAQ